MASFCLFQVQQSFVAMVKDVLQGVKDTMDFTMLTDPVFVIYGLSCIFCMTGKVFGLFVCLACLSLFLSLSLCLSLHSLLSA